MELVTVPRRRPFSARAWAVFVVLVLLPVTLFALLPTAFGLERFVISGDDMSGSVARGSVVFEQRVPLVDVERGDVVTFPSDLGGTDRADGTGAGDTGSVELTTRRVIAAADSTVLTTADRRPDDLVALDATDHPTLLRVVVAVPLVGYPFLGVLSDPLWGAAVILLGVALGALCVGFRRREGESGAEARHRVTTPRGS